MDILTSEARDIGRFIRAKREQASIESYSQFPRRRRHVQYLTQGELAELVGVSTIVISQIEQARYPNVTTAMLQRIAKALNFTTQQRIFLMGLHHARPEKQVDDDEAPAWVRQYSSQIRYPVLIVNPAFDVLALNDRAEVFFGVATSRPVANDNVGRLIFLEPEMRTFIAGFPAMAATVVSALKMYFADSPHYRNRIENLGKELSSADELFRTLWEQDDPLVPATIEKEFNHPIHGTLRINQILADIVEAPHLTKIDFLPADDESAAKLDAIWMDRCTLQSDP